MKTEIIVQTVESMVNTPFLYGNQHHYIKSYSINPDTEKFILTTDKKVFTRPLENAMEFLDQFFPVPDNRKLELVPESNPKGYFIPEITVTASVAKELKDVLMDNIKKVQADKNYIPQAEAVKSNVDTLIALGKTEIEYINAINRLNN